MVALIPLAVCIVGVFATAFQVLKPRLPKYIFKIQNIVPKWINERGFHAKLGSHVKLHNDNFVPIDIHALSFDLFYPNWSGKLDHIGQVTDILQHYNPNNNGDETINNISDNNNNNNNEINDGDSNDNSQLQQVSSTKKKALRPSSSSSSNSQSPPSPLWELSARESFETNDDVMMKPAGGLNVMSSLTWDIIKKWGVVSLPSSGVIHIKANGKVPMTLSIICENSLDTWSLEMEGIACVLDTLDVGWVDLPLAVHRLRNKVLIKQKRII